MSTHHTSSAVRALLSGHSWSGDAAQGPTVITYSFSHAGSQYGADVANFSATLQAFSAADRADVRRVLDNIESVCNLKFVEVQDTGAQSGQIRYAYSQAPNDAGHSGYGFTPSARPEGGDVWVGTAQRSLEWAYMRANLFLHETLHALGLKHPFDGPDILLNGDDFMGSTVMSYSAVAGIPYGALSRYPESPMPLDIAALQVLYGAAPRNTGDTVYDLSDEAFQSGFAALWDAGGNDTLDAGRLDHGVQLDLRAGQRCQVGALVQAFAYEPLGGGFHVTRHDYDQTLAIETDIENATGSQFGDLLEGNALDNVLDGGDGDDVIDGREGHDTLRGGLGNDLFRVGVGAKQIDGGAGLDTARFTGPAAAYSVRHVGDSVTVTRLAGPGDSVGVSAVLRDVEVLRFDDTALPAFQADSSWAQAFRLYKAAFNRLPDADGLVFHAQALQKGAALQDLARQFMASPEFLAQVGMPGDRDFVNLLYCNVLGREADAAGLACHTANLAGGASRADVLVCFAESAENQCAVALVGLSSGQ